jgi:hypothetical protein
MALPPLELFSLRKSRLLPGGFFYSLNLVHSVLHRDAATRLAGLPVWVALRARSITVKSPLEFADVAQLVEQLIRNQ